MKQVNLIYSLVSEGFRTVLKVTFTAMGKSVSYHGYHIRYSLHVSHLSVKTNFVLNVS